MSSVLRGIESEPQQRSRLRFGNGKGAQYIVGEEHVRVAWLDGSCKTVALRAVEPFHSAEHCSQATGVGSIGDHGTAGGWAGGVEGGGGEGEPRSWGMEVGEGGGGLGGAAELELNDNSGCVALEGHREGFVDGDRNGCGGGGGGGKGHAGGGRERRPMRFHFLRVAPCTLQTLALSASGRTQLD
jgi:hypothetical protein